VTYAGTGKSSFVCALCVGLAGSTKLLGRAEEVSSFVRRGTSSGEVAVTLAVENGGFVTVKRRIKSTENKSEFWINGHPATMSKVKDLVKKYNIQLDNLCQFLPQDKVNEFARMKPIELLKATETAIGDGELALIHEDLTKAKKVLDEKEKVVKMTAESLERLMTDFEDLDRLIAPMKEKKKLEEDLIVLEKKQGWAKYEASKEAGKKDEEILEKSRRTIERLEAEFQQSNGPVKRKSAEKTKEMKKEESAKKNTKKFNVDDVQSAVNGNLEHAQSSHEKIADLEEKSIRFKHALEKLKVEVERHRQEVRQVDESAVLRLQEDAKLLEAQLNDLSNHAIVVDSRMEALTTEKQTHTKAIQGLDKRMNHMNNVKTQRLQRFGFKANAVTEMYNHVQANRGRYRGHVYGPLALEIDVQNPHYAAMLEQQIPNNWLSYFIVEYQEDMDTLRKDFLSMKKVPQIACFKGDVSAPLKRLSGNSSDYASLGVTATLDETFQAHPVVKHVLDDYFYLSSIFVMGSKDADWEAVFNANHKLETLWTPEYQIRRRRSKYDSQSEVTSMSALTAPSILYAGSAMSNESDKTEIQAQINRHKKALEDLEYQIVQLTPERDRVAEEKRANRQEYGRIMQTIKTSRDRARMIQSKLAAKERHLETMMNKPDPLEERGPLEERVKTQLKSAINEAVKIPNVLMNYGSSLMKEITCELRVKELTEQINVLGQAEKRKREEMKEMQAMVHQLEATVNNHSAQVASLLNDAKQLTGWPIPQEISDMFDLLPSTVEELQDIAEEKKVRMDSIVISDPGAQQRYNRISQKIEDSEKCLREYEASRAVCEAKVQQLKDAWLPEMRRLVSKINANFSEAFRNVGIAGEVVFNELENEDFAKYSIDLRVKFREGGELMTLDSAYHSGGESSTSTILYLMALQGVTTSPFRVVDEINQGMDSINERSVFKLLVDAATEPDTPQCFLLTPKLLPDLPFSEKVTVLQIMNGVHIKEVANGYADEKFLGRERVATRQNHLQAIAAS